MTDKNMETIPLSKGKLAIVDSDDLSWLSVMSWHIGSDGYASSCIFVEGKWRKVSMHRLINNTPQGIDTDHINRNRLDNRKANLRDALRGQNRSNSKPSKSGSKYKGISFHKTAKKWISSIRVNGKLLHLGYYSCEIEAAKAYDVHAVKYFGEFAAPNFKHSS